MFLSELHKEQFLAHFYSTFKVLEVYLSYFSGFYVGTYLFHKPIRT